MKKLFAILAIAGVMVACNSGADKNGTDEDTTKMDTMPTTPTMPDTSMQTTDTMSTANPQ